MTALVAVGFLVVGGVELPVAAGVNPLLGESPGVAGIPAQRLHAHQIEVLDLTARLNRVEQRTVVVVLHDLNLACRYAHHIVAMRDGAIVAAGPPSDVITANTVSEVFNLDCLVIDDPVSHTPLVVPRSSETIAFAPEIDLSQASPVVTTKR